MNGSSVLYKYIKNALTRFNDELSKLLESLKKIYFMEKLECLV